MKDKDDGSVCVFTAITKRTSMLDELNDALASLGVTQEDLV